MEVKIGKTLNFNGKVLQACESTESNKCKGCFFEERYPLCSDYICSAKEREDGKDIIFKETINKTMITRENVKELLPIFKAYAEGKTIEVKNFKGEWLETDELCFDSTPSNYRIKPEPNYRAFINKKECWDEMHKHPDFGWVVAKDSKIMYHVGVVGLGYVLIDSMSLIFSEAFADYEFTDGKPFGIKEE